MDNKAFVSEIAKLRPSATFLTLHKYLSEAGELADYQIVFHISYKSALERSIATLNAMSLSTDLERVARQELVDSYQASLGKMEETGLEEMDHTYSFFYEDDGKPIKGVKMHNDTGELHLYGLVVNKRVYLPGSYKHVNSKPLTIAKNKLRALTSVGKFRQFRINSNQLDSISVEKRDLLPPESY